VAKVAQAAGLLPRVSWSLAIGSFQVRADNVFDTKITALRLDVLADVTLPVKGRGHRAVGVSDHAVFEQR
jgi:hypothetical protein